MSELAHGSDFVGTWVNFPINPDHENPGRYYHMGIDTVTNIHPAILERNTDGWDLYSTPVEADAIAGHRNLEGKIAAHLGFATLRDYRQERNPLSAYIFKDEESSLHIEIDLSDPSAQGSGTLRELALELSRNYQLSSVVGLTGYGACKSMLRCVRVTSEGKSIEGEISADETYRYEGIFRQFGIKQPA